MDVDGLDGGFGDFSVVADADLGEERLVHQALAEVAGGEVGLERLLRECECVFEGFAEVTELELGAGNELGEGLAFGLDAFGVALHSGE
ncbi:MAG: hypothetical protein ACSLFR_08495 [Solirubrobacteraceae bacterium]